MNCENCQIALLDLVYNELDGSLEEQARAHIEQCEACRLSYQKLNEAVLLAGQLPLLEPSERVSEKILAAAYRKSADNPKQNVVAKTSLKDNLRRLVGVVGHLAMGRQVAMAMVMLLIVAFGLHFLPHLRRTPKATGGTVVNPDGSSEAGPSNELTPAEPFDLTVDFPRGRIRSKESAKNYDHLKESVARPATENAEGARPGPTLSDGTNDDNRSEKAAVVGRFTEENRVRRSSTSSGQVVRERASSLGRGDYEDYGDEPFVAKSLQDDIGFGSEEENARGGASISSSVPMAKSENTKKAIGTHQGVAPQMESADEPRPFPYTAQPAAKQEKPKAATGIPMPTVSEPAAIARTEDSDESRESVETLYRRGVEQYQSGDYSSAISDFNRVLGHDDARELRPQTLYYLARSHQASGRYSLAVENYKLLINGFPKHNQTGPAMLEAARCLRRLGKIAEARALLERASLIPSVAERARRELIALE